jgi:hypothetical protein
MKKSCDQKFGTLSIRNTHTFIANNLIVHNHNLPKVTVNFNNGKPQEE